MILFQKNVNQLILLFEGQKNKSFSIQTQYKILKLKKILEEEILILQEQYSIFFKNYAEFTDQGKLIFSEEGGVKMKSNCAQECIDHFNELSHLSISIPDIYFSLDELEPLGLTLEELELLEPFIKI